MDKTNKKIGGTQRAAVARMEMLKIFKDTSHPMYFAKDIEFALKYNVTRHTIYKIREDLKIPSRSRRIIRALNSLNLSELTIREISEKLGIKYHGIYKMVEDYKLKIKKRLSNIVD